MKHLLLITLISFFIQSSYAQNSTLSLADYKLPEINYHGLNFDFTTSGSYNNTTSNSPFIQDWENSNFSSTVYLNYFRYTSTENTQYVKNIYFSSFPYRRSSTNDERVIMTDNSVGYLSNQLFYNNSNKFWGYDLSTLLHHIYYDKNDTTSLSTYNFINLELNLPIYIGFGRIEEITDIWHAKRLLKKFEERGLLNRSYNDDEFLQFANEISDVRHDRVYDYRLDRIADIKTLDSWLQYTGLINNNGAEYFTTLYDYYSRGVQVKRYSGTRYTLGISPYYSLYYSFIDNNNQENQKAAVYSFIRYDRFKPINDEWQFDINALGLAGYISELDKVRNDGGYIVGGRLELSLGYYPTSRISFNTGLRAAVQLNELEEYSFETSQYVTIKPLNYSIRLNQNINYYISHRTSINFNFYVSYSKQESDYFSPLFENTKLPLTLNRFLLPNIISLSKSNSWNASFNIGFNHAFF